MVETEWGGGGEREDKKKEERKRRRRRLMAASTHITLSYVSGTILSILYRNNN